MTDEPITVHITYDTAEADAAATLLRAEGYAASVVAHRGSLWVQVPGESADEAIGLLGRLDDLIGAAATVQPDLMVPIMPTWVWLVPALLATVLFVQTEPGNVGLAAIIWVVIAAIYGVAHKAVRRYWNGRES